MTAVQRSKSAGGDRPRHGVGAVVEPVGEIEDEGYGDNRDDDEQLCHISPGPKGWHGVGEHLALRLELSLQVNEM
jgi:hypothetical protein